MPAVVLGAVLTANPAFAAEAPIQAKSDLTSAFGSAAATSDGSTFTLANDLSGDAGSYDRQSLGDGKKLTIDLNGHELDLDQIDVGDGSTLIIEDLAPTTGKGLDIGDKAAPFKGTTGVTLGAGAKLSIKGGAKVSTTGGTSAGISTDAADTSSITVGSGADLTAAGAAGSIALGKSPAESKSLTIASGGTLHIPAANTLAVSSGSSVVNNGTVDLQGTLTGAVQNDGTITQASGSSIANASITDNNFLVSYDKGTAKGTVPAATRVLAKDLASVSLDVAPGVTSDGQYFAGWTTDASEGAAVSKTTGLAGIANQTGEVVLHPILRNRVVASTASLAVGTVGHDYKADVKVSKGYGVKSYALAEGSALPAGLGLADDGTISGKPTAATDGAKSFTVEITAEQDTTVVTEQTYSVTVGKATALTATDLAPTVQNNPFSVTLKADSTGPVTYALATTTPLPAGLSLNTATGEISGTPTKSGTFNFSVTASSATYQGAANGGDTASYTLVVQSVPAFTAAKVRSAPVGTNYTGSVKATDADSAAAEKAVTYTISDQGTLPADFKLTSDGALTGRAAVIQDYSFTVTAKGVHGSTTQKFSLSVGAVPVFTSPITLKDATVGDSAYSQQLTANGKGVKFTATNLPAGMAISLDGSGLLTGAPSMTPDDLKNKTYSFIVTATNEYGSVDQTVSITAGTKPIITTTSLLDVGVNKTYTGSLSFTSGTAAKVAVTGLPAGLSYDADAEAIVGSTAVSGSNKVVVTVTNDWGSTSVPLTLVVGEAPAGFVDTLPKMIINTKISQALGATGQGEITYAIKSGSLPEGIALKDGVVSGKPTKAGAYSVTITATTKYGSTDKVYTGTAGAAPAFDGPEVSTGYIGQKYPDTQLLTTGDGTTSFKLADGNKLPAGLDLDPATGTITGTPTGKGSTFAVVVTTPFGTATTSPLTIKTYQPAFFTTKAFTPVVLENGKGTVEQLIGIDGDEGEDGLSLALTSTLPAGLSFDKGRNALYGTVKAAGTTEVSFVATGVGAPTEKTFLLQVGVAPVIAAPTLADGTEGEKYSTPFELASPDKTVAWSYSGKLPVGMGVDEKDGTLSGTPTTSGTFTFTVTATSDFGVATTKELSLTVAAKPVVVPEPDPVETKIPAPVETAAPVKTETPVKVETPAPVKTDPVKVEAPAPVKTTTPAPVVPAPAPVLPALPSAVAAFGHPLALSVAANSTTVVTYSISTGGLPDGVTLNTTSGVISGTPKEVGTFSATIKATNAAGSVEAKLSITVPKLLELVQAKPAAPTVRIGKPVTVKISSLKKGEGYVVRVDGKVKLKGEAKKAGNLSVSVKMPRSLKDKVHTISVTGDRKVTDPAKRAKTAFTVSTITLRKSLNVTANATGGSVTRLAAGEAVTVTLSNGKVVAEGKADKSGVFSFTTSKLSKGSHKLTAHGATDLRVGTVTVKVG